MIKSEPSDVQAVFKDRLQIARGHPSPHSINNSCNGGIHRDKV